MASVTNGREQAAAILAVQPLAMALEASTTYYLVAGRYVFSLTTFLCP